MSNAISVGMTTENKDLLKAIQQYRAEVEKLKGQLDDAGKQGKKGGEDASAGWAKAITSLKNVAVSVVGVGGVVEALNLWRQTNAEIIQEAEEIGRKYDEATRKFRVQSGLRGLDAEEAQKKIFKNSEALGFTGEQGFSAATQLVSSGFSAKEASGESLNAFLKVLAASNLTGKQIDPTELANAVTGYLTSQGKELNAKNVADVGQKVQALFKGSNIQLGDLPQLGKQGAALKLGLSTEEQFAAFATLKNNAFDASSAATALKGIVVRLQSLKDPAQLKDLKRLGLEKSQVDLSGENLDTVLGRLQGGLGKVPEADRAGILKSLVGEEALSGLKTLIDQRGMIGQQLTLQRDTRGFESDVAEATSGRNAAERRLEIRNDQRRLAQDTGTDLRRKALLEQAEIRGAAPIVRKGLGSTFDFAKEVGASDESSAGFADLLPAILGSGSQTGGISKKADEQLKSDLSGVSAAMKENTAALKQNTKVTARDAQTPKPRPSSALGGSIR
jgi:TP901 family phage tail tape measure protein